MGTSAVLYSAQQSPRLKNGVIYWYQGDTFMLTFAIDAINDTTVFNNTDRVTIEFFTHGRTSLLHLEYTEDQFQRVENQYIEFDVEVNEERTNLFARGRYNYDIIYTANDDITTIVSKGGIIVE